MVFVYRKNKLEAFHKFQIKKNQNNNQLVGNLLGIVSVGHFMVFCSSLRLKILKLFDTHKYKMNDVAKDCYLIVIA